MKFGMILATIAALFALMIAPAQAAPVAYPGGNFGCSVGSRAIPGEVKFCIATEYEPLGNGKVVLTAIEFWIAGDVDQLEGGSCDNNPAAYYNARLEGPRGNIRWNPDSNELCESQGWSDRWTVSLKDIGPIGRKAKVISSFKLRDNGGTDSNGVLAILVD
jgi:hypothetical protein